MANGKIRFGKQSGGVLSLSFPDGATDTEVVLPESGELATTASVKAEISNGSNLVTSPTGAIGYGIGAGGTVTQLTSKSTAVTLNKPTGQIITSNSALASGECAIFIFNNSLITTNDNLALTLISGDVSGASYNVWISNIIDNYAYITLKNISAGSRSESVVFNFTVIKGANS